MVRLWKVNATVIRCRACVAISFLGKGITTFKAYAKIRVILQIAPKKLTHALLCTSHSSSTYPWPEIFANTITNLYQNRLHAQMLKRTIFIFHFSPNQ